MILAIDAGNTDIVFGLWDESRWTRTWRIPSGDKPSHEAWQYRLISEMLELQRKPADLSQIVISSVVPALTPFLQEMALNLSGKNPLVVGPEVYPLLKVRVGNPEEIGTDLVANAVAAHDRYQENTIVVDFGTALTFTTISGNGEILGVAIAPGLQTAVRSLFSHTAQLPEVPLETPASAVGKGTVHAIQAGVVLGYTGMVSFLLDHIQAEIGLPCKVIATGGLSEVLTSLKDRFDTVDRMLTMNGLILIAEQEAGSGGR
jgi:type III pantothenate kinase